MDSATADGGSKDSIELGSSSAVPADNHEPSLYEKRTLRKVPDALPWSAFLVAIVELCERFAYNGLSGPFQNYIANSYKDSNGNPGALGSSCPVIVIFALANFSTGLGQAGATGFSNFFQCWCYVTPLLGAVLGDQYFGRYKTIVYSSIVYTIGLLVLFLTALPTSIEHGAALGGLVVSLILIGIGTGGIKANVSPLIAEQYTETRPTTRLLSNGERVIVDPALTIQRIYMIYYLSINVGSLSSIATTEMEKHIGFWSAYLVALVTFCFAFAVLVAGKSRYILRPPRGSVITDCLMAMWIGCKSGFKLDAAKPSYQRLHGRVYTTTWTDGFVEELKQALVACKVFAFFPIYWTVFSQMLNNFISQAGQMELHNIPNDILVNINPLTIIVFIPICDRLIYPFLRHARIEFKPITRITTGFIIGSMAMGYAAFVQHLIYNAGPCYDAPNNCVAGKRPDGTYQHNKVHVAIQSPAYLLIGLSEIFASITGIEYAFTKAPANLKSFINALFLLTSALGSAFGAALAPAARNPWLVRLYVGLAVACFVAGVAFWVCFAHYNTTEDSRNDFESEEGSHVQQIELTSALDSS